MLAELVFTDPHRSAAWAHAVVPPGGTTPLPSAPRRLATEVVGAGTTRDLDAWLRETWTTSLVVVSGGAVVHEWYADGVGPDTLFLGASATTATMRNRSSGNGATSIMPSGARNRLTSSRPSGQSMRTSASTKFSS